MAFKYKQHEDGTSPQKIGEQISIYDKYMATSGANAGYVVVYERGDNGDWSLLKAIPLANDFGTSIKMHKGRLLISYPLVAFCFLLSYEDDFTALQSTCSLATSTNPASSSFGNTVSMSDDYIAIGDPGNDSNKGAVYLYEKSGDSWADATKETQFITPADLSANQLFGTSVAIGDDFLIIGAKGDNSSRGAVYVFVRDEETGIWEQFQKVIASDGVAADEFGGKVSLSGDYFAVGAENVDLSDTEKNVGAVYMFNYSTRWNELRKITSVGESGLIANNFGHSLDLQGDYLIVGSPNAQTRGVADVFYKKRNWGHLKKVDDVLTSTGDSFGESVGIYYPYSIIGAFNYDTDKGRVYFYEDPPVRLRLAQEFEADFQISKASVYLKRTGSNEGISWSLSTQRATIIDASNFSSISQKTNRLIFDDRIVGFTGNGYMSLSPDSEIVGSDFSIIHYPIRNSEADSYNVWVRCHSGSSDPSGSSLFDADLLLDGIVVKAMTSTIANDEWTWVSASLVIPDTSQHILSIRLKEKDTLIDKIYIDADEDFIPEGDGPPYATSPYVTIHMKVYESDGTSPTEPLDVYAYKTTLDEVTQDDWYNFNISLMNRAISEYGETLFLVISSSGASSDNFVIWEIIDSDEYLSGSVGLRLTEIALNSNSVESNLTKRLYYKAKAGNADIDTDTWYLDNTKTHVFKMYSDFDPIRNV